MAKGAKLLGQLLVDAGVLASAALEDALEEQVRSGRRLGEVLVRKGVVDETDVARALATQLSVEFAAPPLRPESKALSKVQPRLARSKGLLPLSLAGRRLRVAMADPLDGNAVDELRFQSGCHVEPVVAPPSAVARGIREAYGGELPELLSRLGRSAAGAPESRSEAQTLEREASAAPVVKIVDHLLVAAMERRASDIHIETLGEGSRVRLRVDGLLTTATELPPGTHRAAISRVKIMAGLDISVRRRPQDGGFTIKRRDANLTVRVSTIPTRGGEKAVLRLLDPGDAPGDLSSLGMAAGDLERLRQILARRQGVLLAAGPTGSGKTTTLSGAVAELSAEAVNIVTLEDPIEYRFPGVAQMEIDRKAGVGFPSGLRAILRQDPDVILVGEVRDRETAEIAMSAAVTGHLVLTTIHTMDAAGAVVRMLEMGVPPFLVAGGMAGVVAQRLVRKLCVRCNGRADAGCTACSDGYRGRSGVFEVLVVDDEIRSAVSAGASITSLRGLARKNGMGSMAQDSMRKVAEGVTSPHEAGRIMTMCEGSAASCDRCNVALPPGAAGCPGCGQPLALSCRCGRPLQPAWRFCPWCVRPAPAIA